MLPPGHVPFDTLMISQDPQWTPNGPALDLQEMDLITRSTRVFARAKPEAWKSVWDSVGEGGNVNRARCLCLCLANVQDKLEIVKSIQRQGGMQKNIKKHEKIERGEPQLGLDYFQS